MRSFTLLQKIAFLLCISFGMSVSAQMVMERTQIAPNSSIKTKPIFDDWNYTKLLDENGQKIYVPTQQINQNAEEDINEDVTLTINLLFDPSMFTGPFLIDIYDENGFRNFAFAFGANTATVDLPPGTYDIFSNFKNEITDYFVIKESIEIQDNTTIEVDVAEAVNYISSLVFNEGGEILEPGIYDPETETIEGGNAHMLFTNIIKFQPDNYTVFNYRYIWDTMQSEDEEPIWNFYINNLSDRYALIQNVIAMGYEGNNYVSKYSTLSGISESIQREVGPEDWSFHREFFQESPLGESQEINYPGLMALSIYENYVDGGWTSFRTDMNADEGIAVYLNNSFDDDPTDFLVFPAIVDHIASMNPMMGDEGFFLGGNAVIKGANGEVLYGSGNTYPSFYFLGYDYYMTGALGWKILPFHPKFTYLASENPGIIQGNNTPVSVTATVGTPKILWKGRYGEGRESDLFSMNVETKQDGNLIFSGSYMEFRDTAFPENGQIEVTFTNANIVVDGMEGKNTTTISYNASEGDNPPTMQMLQFRNTSEKVTDRFNSASEGTVRMAAADFQYNWDTAAYDYVEGNTVEFYYSLYNQNEWTELELTEYPGYIPLAFGDYYEGSLENVYVPEEDSWFDVRVICTDAAGNKQVQVISPAFKVEQATMGIEEVDKSGFTFYPNPFTNELNIRLPENVKGDYTFRVSDLTGKIIHTKNQSEKSFVWNGSSLPKGVYILSIESNGKTIAKKVIKK